jgi:serine/threonine protein kinase
MKITGISRPDGTHRNLHTPLILCNRNRYLILDVLGQGTFGQVVKCQNLKTQEVVAVKVVKNRTAYFNQSMMEVSVLDLVRLLVPTHLVSADGDFS